MTSDTVMTFRSRPDQGDVAVRKVVASEYLSLDGVAEQPDQFVFVTDFDGSMEEDFARIISSQDTVLLGRRTYDDWAAFWPTSDIEPFASFINGVEKFVVTSTPLGQAWSNTTVIDGDLFQFVTDLKQRSGNDIGVGGSITLVQSLLEVGLVDELRLVIAPALQINGRKLFDKGLATRLTLTRHVVSQAGYLLLDFQVGS
jgi:dihydrofolate reductase